MTTTEGTPQGSVASPLLANVYLHYVYDLWVQQWRKRHAKGDMIVVRYADDTIVGFQHRHDAERFLIDLKERLAPCTRRKPALSSSAGTLPSAEQNGARVSRRRSISWGSHTTAPPRRTPPTSNSGARRSGSE